MLFRSQAAQETEEQKTDVKNQYASLARSVDATEAELQRASEARDFARVAELNTVYKNQKEQLAALEKNAARLGVSANELEASQSPEALGRVVERLRKKIDTAANRGDFDTVTQLSPQLEKFENQYSQVSTGLFSPENIEAEKRKWLQAAFPESEAVHPELFKDKPSAQQQYVKIGRAHV